jgi:hemoglobin
MQHVLAPAGAPIHITEAMIERLVRAFYVRVRADARLGPIFEGVLGADWEPHLAKMIDFWSSLMLTTGRYSGQPMQKHAVLAGVRRPDFEIWLGLFEATAQEICGDTAGAFIFKAHRVADSLQRAMFYDPAGDRSL